MASDKTRGEPVAAATSTATPIRGPLVGWITGLSGGGDLLVDFDGNDAGPLPARSTVAMAGDQAAQAVADKREAVLFFEDGDPARPLLMGLLQPKRATPHLDLILEATKPEGGTEELAERATLPAELSVDGGRFAVVGKEEVVLRCGKASITLRKSGKIVIRGTYLVSRSSGVNTIKGGSVKIN